MLISYSPTTKAEHSIELSLVHKQVKCDGFVYVGSVSASRTVGREFASRPGHTKDHHKNGTNCLPA